MKVKTAELDGLALDWAVAVARNMPDIKIFGPVRHNDRGWIEVRFNPDHRALGSRYDPSINPEFSWPIIDANGISLIKQTETRWVSEYSLGCSRPDHARAWGPSSLVAALRCFCLEKHGDEIEVPERVLRSAVAQHPALILPEDGHGKFWYIRKNLKTGTEHRDHFTPIQNPLFGDASRVRHDVLLAAMKDLIEGWNRIHPDTYHYCLDVPTLTERA